MFYSILREFITPEMGTLEWDTFNSDCLIQISNLGTFNFLLISCYFWIFLKLESPSHFLYINLKRRPKLKISRLLIRNSADWLDFIHFSGYKYKIRLVFRLRKREDHALISISTILKFSAVMVYMFDILSFSYNMN